MPDHELRLLLKSSIDDNYFNPPSNKFSEVSTVAKMIVWAAPDAVVKLRNLGVEISNGQISRLWVIFSWLDIKFNHSATKFESENYFEIENQLINLQKSLERIPDEYLYFWEDKPTKDDGIFEDEDVVTTEYIEADEIIEKAEFSDQLRFMQRVFNQIASAHQQRYLEQEGPKNIPSQMFAHWSGLLLFWKFVLLQELDGHNDTDGISRGRTPEFLRIMCARAPYGQNVKPSSYASFIKKYGEKLQLSDVEKALLNDMTKS